MSLQAYQRVAARAETPREAEYRLFGQVTRALMEAAALPADDIRGRMDALDWNRRLWSALASDCAESGNGLPDALRASMISLSLWVGRHTSAVIRQEEEIEPLIEINRMIMQGLVGNSGGGVEAA
ncbi:flagellar protein FlaF [Caulobacter ginsengisoli]|uniref:Flagellar protein FlaF n=1 Tax=Caulobacter ginsengisoli TaxID=400775 RepID=A0ABU0IRD8_9CAUL|nr:flagellar biosynthesis regulator FlaF [Caulobacter ginsengisoli]MDQ0463921.1 flagellar protein FlaF [Caulobacter ginsengisoli]